MVLSVSHWEKCESINKNDESTYVVMHMWSNNDGSNEH